MTSTPIRVRRAFTAVRVLSTHDGLCWGIACEDDCTDGDVSKAKAVEDTCGLLQVVKHHETDELVDVHVAGARAADMIPKATLAVKYGLTVDNIIDTIHPFPTFSEALKHACQAFRQTPRR